MASFKDSGIQFETKIGTPTPDSGCTIIYSDGTSLKTAGQISDTLAIRSELASLTGSLQSQIDVISGGGIEGPYVVSVNGISGHVNLYAGYGLAISGTTYSVTGTFGDSTLRSEVAVVTGSLQNQINAISGGGITGPYVISVNGISGNVNFYAGTGLAISGTTFSVTATGGLTNLATNSQVAVGTTNSTVLSGSTGLRYDGDELNVEGSGIVVRGTNTGNSVYAALVNYADNGQQTLYLQRYAFANIAGNNKDYVRTQTIDDPQQLMIFNSWGGISLTAYGDAGSGKGSQPIKFGSDTLEWVRMYAGGGVQIGGTYNSSPGDGNLVVAGISGNAGNLVAHDISGRLIDGGSLTNYATTSLVNSVSGNLYSLIQSSSGASVSLSGYTTIGATANLTGNLQSQITSIQGITGTFTLNSTTASISSNLQGQITGISGISLSANNTFSGINVFTKDISANGLTIGRGPASVITNTAFGIGALKSVNSKGTGNTAIGYQAMTANTGNDGASTSGLWNTAVGDSALLSMVGSSLGQAISNTAVGNSALNAVTTGTNNTGIGKSSGTTLQTGDSNTFIGAGATSSVTALTNATAIGASSTVGTSNTMVFGASTVTAFKTGSGNDLATFKTLASVPTTATSGMVGQYGVISGYMYVWTGSTTPVRVAIETSW